MRLFAWSYFAYFIHPFSHFSRYLEAKDAKNFRGIITQEPDYNVSENEVAVLQQSNLCWFSVCSWARHFSRCYAYNNYFRIQIVSWQTLSGQQHSSQHWEEINISLRHQSAFYRKNAVLFTCPIHNIHTDLREAQYENVKLHLCFHSDQRRTLQLNLLIVPIYCTLICNLLYFSLQHGTALHHTNEIPLV